MGEGKKQGAQSEHPCGNTVREEGGEEQVEGGEMERNIRVCAGFEDRADRSY